MTPSLRVLIISLSSVWLVSLSLSHAAVKKVHVFVALCDNKTQGIQPVGKKIGNGDDAASNLYWGCSDGLSRYFKRSKLWKLNPEKSPVTEPILQRLKFLHHSGSIKLTADAYRGARLKQCLIDFEKAVTSGEYDLVAFIGHNGLMDFTIPSPPTQQKKKTDVIVLCCKSDPYFSARLTVLGGRPVLMTKQLMYPGSFILHDALESWSKGHSLEEIRSAAARAYARNQKISLKAAKGVFTALSE